jgi:predicted naringenin-chalcone synthase
MSYLHSIQVALPDFKTSQDSISVFMQNWYGADEEISRKIQLMYARSGISFRHSCIDDFTGNSRNQFFANDSFPGISKRMEKYFEIAPLLANKASHKSINTSGFTKDKITHLITISCTGMAAPGLDLMLIESLNLPLDIQRTSVNFMGCYAGFHGLKMAHQITLADSNANVLLMSVELCTLHFQKEYSIDQVAANLLFADGAAACIISSEKPLSTKSISLNSFYSMIIPKGNNDMAWNISELGFLMKLSAYIPDLLKDGMGPILENALIKSGLSKEDIHTWAIHPGGKKILDKLKTELVLGDAQLQASYQTLADYGNMSSATIFFVLKYVLESENYEENQTGFAAGFGPGLTVETLIFNK